MAVEVSFGGVKLAKSCTDHRLRQRRFGTERAKKIVLRLNQLSAAEHLGEMMTLPQARCHQLSADRDEAFSLDLDGPYRMIVEIAEIPVPRNQDGGVLLSEVRHVVVTDIVDTH
ncbi:type II toxin-antitoxin system RelE/ParE family toxin [Mycobacterium rhizamassiliense]|uniref:type II toxin-antitoxin system RelE/ParE family toxin n=1 Tax=Mycobacterium rhizamassiliense TaxID=1841860 RepID=UPI0009F8EC01|nr:type II toxin-antitoxin system RelE/ParE family toxin [Mycobacterium rhizamassiliense]